MASFNKQKVFVSVGVYLKGLGINNVLISCFFCQFCFLGLINFGLYYIGLLPYIASLAEQKTNFVFVCVHLTRWGFNNFLSVKISNLFCFSLFFGLKKCRLISYRPTGLVLRCLMSEKTFVCVCVLMWMGLEQFFMIQ